VIELKARVMRAGAPRRGGFTLAEVLVVMGIITVLIGILFPVLSLVRQHAVQAKCASNLRQIGMGLEMYNQVNRHLPLAADGAGLAEALAEIKSGTPKLLVCPADDSGGYSYRMNAGFAGLPKSSGNPGDVLASESAARHRGKSNVLFFDGHVSGQ